MSERFAGGWRPSYGSTSETRDTRIPEVSYSGTQFSPTEMYDLSENITANIYTINTSWKQLETTLKLIGTTKDSQAVRNKLHETQTASNQIISQTTKDLHRLTMIVRRGDKQQKLQVDKLTNNFKEAVQIYSRTQKQVAEKMKLGLLQVESVQSEDNYSKAEDEQQLLSKQKMVAKDLEFEQGLLIEREQVIKQIENDILDVNQIMRELGAMVHLQSDTINSIEDSIETVHGAVQAGTQELETASSYQDKRRRKTCYLLLISVAVGLALAVVLAISLK